MDVLVVPSADVRAVDCLVGTWTARRLARAFRLWRRNRAQYFIVTGGVAHPLSIQTRPATMLMRDWLLARGVPDRQIILGPAALETYAEVVGVIQTLSATHLGLGEQYPPRSITVVSDYLHTWRIARYFSALGYTVALEAMDRRYNDAGLLWSWVLLVAAYLDPFGIVIPRLVTAYRQIRRGR